MRTVLHRSLVLLCLSAGSALRPAEPQAIANAVDERSGISIDFSADDSIFPTFWLSERIAAKATPLPASERQRSARLIKEAMAVYPVSLLKKNLKAVHAVGSMEFFGLKYGGTNSLDAIYISDNGEEGIADVDLRGEFHHEFSSILLRNNPEAFDTKAWMAALPEGFEYGSGGIDAIRDGKDDLSYREKYNKDGFLNQYGQSDIEDDFNTFAEGMLGGRKAFWEVADKYPLVGKKAKVIVAFYHALDPSFTEQSLRDLAKE